MIDIWYHPKIKHLYSITYGRDGSEGFILFISKTKKRAIKLIKKDGCKYNKRADLWENDRKFIWYKIEEIEYLI